MKPTADPEHKPVYLVIPLEQEHTTQQNHSTSGKHRTHTQIYTHTHTHTHTPTHTHTHTSTLTHKKCKKGKLGCFISSCFSTSLSPPSSICIFLFLVPSL